jgi:hypothetical protein
MVCVVCHDLIFMFSSPILNMVTDSIITGVPLDWGQQGQAVGKYIKVAVK